MIQTSSDDIDDFYNKYRSHRLESSYKIIIQDAENCGYYFHLVLDNSVTRDSCFLNWFNMFDATREVAACYNTYNYNPVYSFKSIQLASLFCTRWGGRRIKN